MINYSRTQGASFMIGAMLVVFYFAYPIGENLRSFDLTLKYKWLVVLPIIGGLIIVQSFIINGKLNYFINIFLLALYSIICIFIAFLVEETIGYMYYYVYLIIILMLILINGYGLKILNRRDE